MSEFSKEELKRYNRQMILPEVGKNGQLTIKNSRVLIIGAGGLGCPVALYLTAAGIGHITIVDFDSVEASNLHRQILYSETDIGKSKAICAAEKLGRMNPHINIHGIHELVNENTAKELLKNYDIVIDGSDNFLTRYLVNDTCIQNGTPLIYGSILGNEGQIAVFNYKGSKNLRDLFPEPPNPDEVPSCSENGVVGTVPGIIGTIMANTCIEILLKTYQSENTLTIFNARNLLMQKVKF